MFVKIRQTVQLKLLDSIVCKLYLKKARGKIILYSMGITETHHVNKEINLIHKEREAQGGSGTYPRSQLISNRPEFKHKNE